MSQFRIIEQLNAAGRTRYFVEKQQRDQDGDAYWERVWEAPTPGGAKFYINERTVVSEKVIPHDG